MTQLAKRRPMAIWSLFLAGAITGGIASSLFEPQHLRAEPRDLNGQKFEELHKLVMAHELLLKGISRDEEGLTINEPVKIELLDELETAPALQVLGRSRFTGDPGPDEPLVWIDPVMIHPTHGVVEITDPDGGLTSIGPAKIELLRQGQLTTLGWDKVELLGPATKATLFPDRIELLHQAADDPVLLGADATGGYLGAGEALFKATVWAAEFVDTDDVIQPF